MCFPYVQVERRRAVGGVETVESNKMDVWNFKCSRVFIHGFAFPWIASAEYLGTYYLWLIRTYFFDLGYGEIWRFVGFTINPCLLSLACDSIKS